LSRANALPSREWRSGPYRFDDVDDRLADDSDVGRVVDEGLMGRSGHDVVWQQRAFITQLPPGDYASVWVSTYQGVLNDTATVNVHILPREQCS
jgi:hypothetical protein